MLTNTELKNCILMSSHTYQHVSNDLFSSFLVHRIKDNDGFYCHFYLDSANKTIYVSFKGINESTLKSRSLKNNLMTGGAHQYSTNFHKIKFWMNAFAKKLDCPIHDIKFYIIGHSMGGALAQHLLFDLYLKNIFKARLNYTQVKLVTFNGLGGMLGNFFLNQNRLNVYRSKAHFHLIKRMVHNTKTYHFAHEHDMVSKILEHTNKHQIYILKDKYGKKMSAFTGEENAHNVTIFLDLFKTKHFHPIKIHVDHFEHYSIKEFLNSSSAVFALFYILFFRQDDLSIIDYVNLPKYYKSYQRVRKIKKEILQSFNHISKKLKYYNYS